MKYTEVSHFLTSDILATKKIATRRDGEGRGLSANSMMNNLLFIHRSPLITVQYYYNTILIHINFMTVFL